MSDEQSPLYRAGWNAGYKHGVWQSQHCAAQPAASGEPAAYFSPVTVLPDGSAFATASFPLPKDHWLTAPRGEWDNVRDEYAECPAPVLTHASRDAVQAAVRYAVRGATMCGQDADLDPDALVLNAIYALCGPFGGATAQPAPAPTKAQRVHAIVNAGPFPGMSEAFNAHMGAECWTDPAYAPDASTWAAAWKATQPAPALVPPKVTPHNVGRWCMSEDDCRAAGIDFAAYERGVADAAEAFGRNKP